MKQNLFFLILFSVLIIIPLSITNLKAQEQTFVRGSDYLDIDHGDGKHTWQSQPEWILANGQYKPYKLFQDANTVVVETMQGSFVFNKNNCAISFYNDGLVGGENQPVIGSDSYVALGTTVGSQNFVKVNSINNALCQTTVIESGNDIEVQGTKHVDNVGTFKIRYIKNNGQDLKTQIEATNLNPAWNNHKLGITQTMHVPQFIKLGNETKNLANFNNTVLDRTWLTDHKAQLVELSNKINFDFDLGFQYVEKVTILWDGTTAKLVIDYWYNTPQILPGQTLVIDPTTTLAQNDRYQVQTLSTAAATCGAVDVKAAGDQALRPAAATNERCYIGGAEFNVSTIPNNAAITQIIFEADVASAAYPNPTGCDVVQMSTHDLSTLSAATMWTEVTTGTAYLTNSAQCSADGVNRQTAALGSTANSNLKTQLTSGDLFSVGLRVNDYNNRGGADGQAVFTNEELIVTYDATRPDRVTVLDVTSNAGTSVGLSWSQPDLHSHPILGYQINYTTPYGNPTTILTNNTGNSATTGTVSGLTERTPYSFRVSAWTETGNNATGKILNVTTLANLSIGALNLTGSNADIIPIRFERNNINSTSLFLNITYTNTFTLACDLHYKFAQINRTYHSITSTIVGSDKHSAFRFNHIDNEIVDVFCWNQSAGNMLNNTNVNSSNSGRYLITQTAFPLLEQAQNFKAGGFGTNGMFGVIDVITLIVIIISMIGLNRVNESVGGVFVIAIVGVCWYFGFISLENFMISAIALAALLIYGSTKKD